MPSSYQFVYIIAQCLHPQLDAGGAELQHPPDFFATAPVRPGLDAQSGTAVSGRLVNPLGFLEGLCHDAVQSIVTSLGKRILVIHRLSQEGPSHNYQLDFIRGVSHSPEYPESHFHLLAGIIVTLDGA